MPKFFVRKDDITENIININGDEAKHIFNVLRHKIGDELLICDGDNTDYSCIIDEISKSNVKLRIVESYKINVESNLKITLYQAMIKPDKMDLVIQKAVELGVTSIVPFMSEHSVIKIGDKQQKKVDRFNKISESAAKQSMRGIIPIVHDICTLKEALENANSNDENYVAYENERKQDLKEYFNKSKGNSIGIFVGPEGGFHKDEISFMTENNVKIVSLGKRILRSETAGTTAMIMFMYERGEM